MASMPNTITTLNIQFHPNYMPNILARNTIKVARATNTVVLRDHMDQDPTGRAEVGGSLPGRVMGVAGPLTLQKKGEAGMLL